MAERFKVITLCGSTRFKEKFIEAQKNHYKLLDFINLLFADGSPGGIKTALSKMNITQNYLRPPLAQVNKQIATQIQAAVEKLM